MAKSTKGPYMETRSKMLKVISKYFIVISLMDKIIVDSI